MRICLDYRPALHESTGVGSYVVGLLRALVRTHPEASYVALSASWRHRLRPPADLADAVRFLDLRLPVRGLDLFWHRFGAPRVERWTGPIDIAHSPSPLPLPTRAGRQVVTVHDCYFLRHPEQVEGPMRRDYGPLLERALARADAVMVNSRTTRAELLELTGVADAKVHVAPLGIDPLYPDPAAARPPEAAAALPERFLLFVGRLEPRKDPATLLAAFARVIERAPATGLVLVGPDGPAGAAALARAPARVRRAIVRLPYQPSPVLAWLYRRAVALLLPSRWEGFGLTALEAMACGTPVVAARAGALAEVLGTAAWLVEPGDSEAFADACLALLRQDAAQEWRRRGLARAAGYRWERTAEITFSVYRRLVAA